MITLASAIAAPLGSVTTPVMTARSANCAYRPCPLNAITARKQDTAANITRFISRLQHELTITFRAQIRFEKPTDVGCETRRNSGLRLKSSDKILCAANRRRNLRLRPNLEKTFSQVLGRACTTHAAKLSR